MQRSWSLVASAMLSVAATLLGQAEAALAALTPASKTSKSQVGMCWIMLAVFVIGTLAIAFKSSKRREEEG